MKKLLVFLGIFFTLAGCKKDDSLDPKLVGTWSDFNAEYSFKQDFTYEIKYLRAGKGPDTVTVDSVFGEYSLDRKKDNITFNQKGYREKFTGMVIFKDEYGNSWNYSYTNDSTLKYTSHTTLGVLYKE